MYKYNNQSYSDTIYGLRALCKAIKSNGGPVIDYLSATAKEQFLAVPGVTWREHVIEPLTLDQAKTNKLAEISSAFDNEMRTGTALTKDSWSIDARRSDTKNDLQNMQVLLSTMQRNGDISTMVKGADNMLYSCWVEDIEALIVLLEETATARYNKKFMLESTVAAAQTIEIVESVQW